MTDREKLIALLNEAGQRCGDIECYDCEECEYAGEINGCVAFIADHLLANGVVVREKGEWTEHQHTSYDDMREENVIWFTYACSECGGEVMNDYDFCPNCGADMRKGENG